MFAAMYKSLSNESQMEKNKLEPEIVEESRKNVEHLLTDLCEVNYTSNDDVSSSTSKDTSIEVIESSLADIHLEYLNDSSIENFTTNEIKKNEKSLFRKELRSIVIKHKNGEDPLPYLIDLLDQFKGHDKLKIKAQICSYIVLFTKNLRACIEQFVQLIEHPEIVNNDLITKHYSTFGSKKFNLAELICNEIRLATNASGSSSEDMLFYFKMFTKIVETCNIKIKDVDPSMKSKLIDIVPTKLKCLNTCQSESDLLTYNVDDKNINIRQKQQKKHWNCPSPKSNLKPKVSNKPQKKNYSTKNAQTKTHKTNANDIDQLQPKMVKFLDSSPAEGDRSSKNSNHLTTESLRNLQNHLELQKYTQQLYQNILSITHQQYNLHNITPQGLNRFFNQNHANLNCLSQQSPFRNLQTPPLLSLRPQISQENPKPTNQQQKKMPTKKK